MEVWAELFPVEAPRDKLLDLSKINDNLILYICHDRENSHLKMSGRKMRSDYGLNILLNERSRFKNRRTLKVMQSLGNRQVNIY